MLDLTPYSCGSAAAMTRNNEVIIVVSTTISIRNALLRWLWVGCAGQGLRPVKVFEQPAPRCRKPQCIRQPPRGVEPPPVPRPIARMPGSRTARLVRSPAITCRRPAQSPSILCGGRSPDGKIAESANHRSREGLVQVQGNCRVSHWAVAEGHLSPPIFGECHYARPDPVFLNYLPVVQVIVRISTSSDSDRRRHLQHLREASGL